MRASASRPVVAASAVLVGLFLAVAAPSFGGPGVGCHSNVGGHSAVGDQSDPCVLTPDVNDSGTDSSGGLPASNVAPSSVVSATPTFTG